MLMSGWADLYSWLGAGTAGFLGCISHLSVVSPAQWLQGSWLSYMVAKAPTADVLRQRARWKNTSLSVTYSWKSHAVTSVAFCWLRILLAAVERRKINSTS